MASAKHVLFTRLTSVKRVVARDSLTRALYVMGPVTYLRLLCSAFPVPVSV
jgi:hypothetical protein